MRPVAPRFRFLGPLGVAGLVAASLSSPAAAQAWLLDARAGLASGAEAGAASEGVGWQRARTQLWASLDGRVDERPHWGYGSRVFVELERTIGVGAELGAIHELSPKIRIFAGLAGVVLPQSVLGPSLRVHYRMPWTENLSLSPFVGLSALALGSDLPEGGALFWLTIGVGVEAPL